MNSNNRKKCPLIVLCLLFVFSIFIIPAIVGIVLYIRNVRIDKENEKLAQSEKVDMENQLSELKNNIDDLMKRKEQSQTDYQKILDEKENLLECYKQEARVIVEEELKEKLEHLKENLQQIEQDISVKELTLTELNDKYNESQRTIE